MPASITSIFPVILSSPTSGSNQARNDDGYDTVMKIVFCFISISSIVPNVLFLIAMLLDYSRMRRGNHNILLYNMMISDTLAGVAILATPNLILPANLMNNPHRFAGELYCRILVSQFMLFFFGVASVYTVVFLSTERWLAVKYPFKYRTTISHFKVKACVIFIWLLGFLTNAPHLTEMGPKYVTDTRNPCKWKNTDYQKRQTVAFIEISLKFVVPSLVLVLQLCSLYRKFHRENTEISTRPDRERQLLRMSTATSFAVLLCWSPNQVYYLLYKFDVVEIGTNWHHFTVVLALSTSTINPIIYFATSTAYRQCLLTFLCKVCRICRRRTYLTRTYPLAGLQHTNTARDNQIYREQAYDSPLFTYSPRTPVKNNSIDIQ